GFLVRFVALGKRGKVPPYRTPTSAASASRGRAACPPPPTSKSSSAPRHSAGSPRPPNPSRHSRMRNTHRCRQGEGHFVRKIRFHKPFRPPLPTTDARE